MARGRGRWAVSQTPKLIPIFSLYLFESRSHVITRENMIDQVSVVPNGTVVSGESRGGARGARAPLFFGLN